MSINATSTPCYPAGRYDTQAHTTINGHGASTGYLLPVHVNRSEGFPSRAAGTSTCTHEPHRQDLSRYQVDRSRLDGLQPDRNGVYTRVNHDGREEHFIDMGRNVYQVGDFDSHTSTWHVLDPKTGKAVGTLGRPDNVGTKWVWQSDLPPEVVPGPQGAGGTRGAGGTQGGGGAQRGGGTQGGGGIQPGPGAGSRRPGISQVPRQVLAKFSDRLMQALDKGIQTVQRALDQIDEKWSDATAQIMSKLFGPEALTPEGRKRIKQQLLATLAALQKSKSERGADIKMEDLSGSGAAAQAHPWDGTISFDPSTVGRESDEQLAETMVHEHMHVGTETDDKWYLNPDESRRPKLDHMIYPFTFENAVDNADTVARAATTLARN